MSPLLELVPVLQRLAVWLPDRAGQVAGLAVLTLWAAVAVLGAWWALRRRDA